MKDFIKKIIKYVVAVILLIVPVLIINYQKNNDVSHNAALRWDSSGKSAHISVFMSEDAKFTLNNVMEFEENMKNTLTESNALTNKSGYNTWVDSYSAKGQLTISRDNVNAEVSAIGVGGDFFFFHPLELVNGSYFTPDNLMDDLLVLDEDTAWRLFGSTDIQGMTVEINGKEYIISGVIKRDEGRLNKEAGNNKPTVYVSYNLLNTGEEETYITDYEVILPDLTKNYAYNIVKKGIDLSEDNRDIVKTDDRYSVTSLIKLLKTYGKRSMKTNGVVYPYWENVARGREDICVYALLAEIIIAVICIVYVVIKLVKLLRRNSENIKKWFSNVFEAVKYKLSRKKKVERPEINTVIFDIGNVLAKFVPMQYLKSIGYDGEERDEIFNAIIENDIWNEYDKGIMTETEVINKYIERYPKLEDAVRKVFSDMKGIVRRFEYTDEWIESLKEQNIRVLYLSNISKTLYSDCEEELNFVDDMDGGILSFEEKCSKPDSEIYKKLINKYNLEPDACIFVDDRQANIKAAADIGLNGIYFNSYDEASREIIELINKRNTI
ncbi:MAG: HAD-IA family hydrolase [Lachnospiraceae bacterium]|nr:HAD-IA family hydrolase [Lachnospiraceae bacterium]